MKNLLKIFYFLIKNAESLRFSRSLVVLVVVTGVLSGLASVGFISVINRALTGTGSSIQLIWMFVGLCVALPVFRFISNVLLVQIVQRVLFGLRIDLCSRILAAPLRHLEKIGPARLLATLTEDLSMIVNAFGSIPLLILQSTVAIGCLVYLVWLSPVLFAMFLGFVVFGMLSYHMLLVKAQSRFQLMREAWDDLFGMMRGLTEGTKELKMHRGRRNEYFEGEIQEAAERWRHYTVVGRTIYAAANSSGQVIFFVVIGLILFAAPLFKVLDAATITGFTLTILYLMTPMDVLLNLLPTLGQAVVSARHVEEIGLSLVEEPTDIQPVESPHSETGSWNRLQLLDVIHSYTDETRDESFVVGPLNLTFEPGEIVFIVGGNGSGKTTLAKILVGLYSPEGGEIRLDGESIEDIGRDDYRQLFSVVFSDFFLFENLRGIAQEGLDGQAREYLSRLQLDRKVTVEDGRLSTLDLSQGQRKRLALLTAYLEDRSIYLFDEWAADQDPIFKNIFYRKLLPELQARGKTIFVISHDDHYYHLADRIVKIDSGKIEYDGDAQTYLDSALGELPLGSTDGKLMKAV